MLDYLTLSPEVFGIDISDLSLKIIKLEKKKGSLGLASFGETEIGRGIIEAGEIKDENALAEIIKKAVSQVKGKKIRTKYLIASLPEEGSFLQVIQMPLMAKEEVDKAVYFEAENYIPIPVEKAYLDSQVISPVLSSSGHLDVLIAASPKKTVDSYLSSFQKSGLRSVVFEVESQAIARSLVPGEKSSEPLLIIDVGATRSSFIIFSGQSLRFTTSLPISSQKFTENIASSFKIAFKEAEKLKEKYGIESNDGKRIFDAIEPDLENLVDQIKKYLDYYQTHFSHEHLPRARDSAKPGKSLVKKIILCGGGANLKGLDNFLSQKLKLQVILGNPWSNILPQPLREVPELPYAESLKYATALGLALRRTKM